MTLNHSTTFKGIYSICESRILFIYLSQIFVKFDIVIPLYNSKMAAKKNWIKGAIKRPGALRKAAKAANQLNKDNTIKESWLNVPTKNKRLQKQKNLAKTLKRMKKK